MYVNARSIVHKVNDLHAILAIEDPDIFGITETWLNDTITDAELGFIGYSIFRCDRPGNQRGGGVVLYVRTSLMPVAHLPTSKFPERYGVRFPSILLRSC